MYKAMFDTIILLLSATLKKNSISARTKMKLYRALVTPVLMYGSECGYLQKEDERRILEAEMNWRRLIAGKGTR